MFHLPDEVILQKMAPVFDSEAVPVVYKRFLGIDRSSGSPVERWDYRPAMALVGKRKKFTTTATKEVVAQVMDQSAILKSGELLAANTEFPDGIEFKQLTENDELEYNGQCFGVKNHRYVSPFIRIEMRGS